VGPGVMDLMSFEVGTGSGSSTSEAGTIFSMAAGLLLIGVFRWRGWQILGGWL